jgi:hypothetical protein
MSKSKKKVLFLDPSIDQEKLDKAEENGGWYTEAPLVKSLMRDLRTSQKAQALSFDVNPSGSARFSGLYIDKTGTPLLPDTLIKRMFLVDDLLGTIERLRANMFSAHGHRLLDRYSYGYRLDPNKKSGFKDLPVEEKLKILQRAHEVESKIATCGNLSDLDHKLRMTFPEYMYVSGSNAIRFGRIATEKVRDSNGKFCGFRAVDAATIFYAKNDVINGNSIRETAVKLLEDLTNQEGIKIPKVEDRQLAFMQVIEGTVRNVFTEHEMAVHNFFPSTDIETNWYPVTPMDSIINAVITHINISNHNKLFFQNGRAARGMVVIQSDTISDETVEDFKQGFQANINNVSNSWRVPVLRITQNDKVVWQTLDTSGRDMEFQYQSDNNVRTILAAFAMSPDEIPGFNHLSKGSNTQTLSESSGEFKLLAARDVGIRPLISGMEAFLNDQIIPEFDPEVAKYFSFKFYGLESDDAEKESVRIEKAQQLYSSFNDTLRMVEKDEIPDELGGRFPMSMAYSSVLDKYVTVGKILEFFFGIQGASKDPKYDYCRDNFYFQNLQLIQQQQMAQQQQQMAQQQMAQQQAQQPGQQAPQQEAQPEQPKTDEKAIAQFESKIEEATRALSKKSPNNDRLLARQDSIRQKVKETWDKEVQEMLAQLKGKS